jgi:hypothetical protein
VSTLFYTKLIRGVHFQFGSVFIKKNNQTEIVFFFKKTETELKPGQTDRFRSGSVFLEQNRFKPVWLGFFWFWLGFFWFFVGFGSVQFFAYKAETEPNRTGRFFQKFNRFFSVRFFRLFFFSGFLDLIGFPVFFSPLKLIV